MKCGVGGIDMSTFKQKLNAAVESVFSKLNSLSSEELQAKVDSYKNDERTSSLFYAWNEHVSESVDFEIDINWTKLPKISIKNVEILFEELEINFDSLSKKTVKSAADTAYVPSLFSDDRISVKDCGSYGSRRFANTSDDYLDYLAAA